MKKIKNEISVKTTTTKTKKTTKSKKVGKNTTKNKGASKRNKKKENVLNFEMNLKGRLSKDTALYKSASYTVISNYLTAHTCSLIDFVLLNIGLPHTKLAVNKGFMYVVDVFGRKLAITVENRKYSIWIQPKRPFATGFNFYGPHIVPMICYDFHNQFIEKLIFTALSIGYTEDYSVLFGEKKNYDEEFFVFDYMVTQFSPNFSLFEVLHKLLFFHESLLEEEFKFTMNGVETVVRQYKKGGDRVDTLEVYKLENKKEIRVFADINVPVGDKIGKLLCVIFHIDQVREC